MRAMSCLYFATASSGVKHCRKLQQYRAYHGLFTMRLGQSSRYNISRYRQKSLISHKNAISRWSSTTVGDKTTFNCDVVQGPSMVRTNVHRPNPSLMFVPGLRSLPLWTKLVQDKTRVAYQDPTVQHAISYLEEHVDIIRQEYETVAPALMSDYQVGNRNNKSSTHHNTKNDEHTDTALHQGTWEWHTYMSKGQVQGHFAQHFPTTTQIIQKLRSDPNNIDGQHLLFEGVPFGYCFFSTLHPNSSIQSHTAPMNFRLRIHLPLSVPRPDSSSSSCGIRIGPVTTEWTNGKALVLDDSYDHEVWNNTNDKRVLFLVDMWHPDITIEERQNIVQMFQHAQKQGWWGDERNEFYKL